MKATDSYDRKRGVILRAGLFYLVISDFSSSSYTNFLFDQTKERALKAPAKVVTAQYLSSIRCAGLLRAPAVQRAWPGCVVAAEHAPRPPGHAGPRNQAPMPPWYVNKQ